MKVLRSSSLLGCTGVTHGFFTRVGGVSEGLYGSLNCGLGSLDDPRRVQENLTRVAEYMAVDAQNLVTLKQTHSTDVCVIDEELPKQRPQADALVTAIPCIALGITGADCPTVLFADDGPRVIGAAHAGWRGAFNGVLEATLAAMQTLGAQLHDVVAAVGPGIQQPSYEVGADFRAVFVAQDAGNEQFFAGGADRLLFDLPAYIEQRILNAGVQAIDRQTHDTFSDDDLFSYRRSRRRGEPDYGRQLGAIVLR